MACCGPWNVSERARRPACIQLSGFKEVGMQGVGSAPQQGFPLPLPCLPAGEKGHVYKTADEIINDKAIYEALEKTQVGAGTPTA